MSRHHIHNILIYSLVCLLGLLVAKTTFAQKSTPKKKQKTPVFQGICGTVTVLRGNFMPSPDRPAPKGHPAERDVLIYPLLNQSQVHADIEGFIDSIRIAKPVKVVRSDKNGKFSVRLPVGKYSVLVREEKGLYANLFDTQNNIFPVNVTKNRSSTIKIEITHQAAF